MKGQDKTRASHVRLNAYMLNKTGWGMEASTRQLDRAIVLLAEAAQHRGKMERLHFPQKPEGVTRTLEDAAAYGKKLAEYNEEIARLQKLAQRAEAAANGVAKKIGPALSDNTRITRNIEGAEYEVQIGRDFRRDYYIELRGVKAMRFNLDDGKPGEREE